MAGAAAIAGGGTVGLDRRAVNAKLGSLIATGAIAFAVFTTGFVVREPAPYELFLAALMPVWALFGLSISRTLAPLPALLVLFVIGGMISTSQLKALEDIPLYITVTLFLTMTAVFFAAVIEKQPQLYRVIFWAWVWSAVATTLLGVAGYFGLTPGGMFTLYGRAAGAFKDPNVFGPFLVLPAIFMLQRIMASRLSALPFYGAILLVLFAGIFLSFSRGAWGLFLFCAAAMAAAMALQSKSNLFRLRIAIMAVVAVALLAIALVVVMQLPGVAEIFSDRAKLVQDYDGARLGRFARFAIGFQMAMEHPLGIGPLAFGKMLGEDTHNIWLKTLLDYSWLGFASYLLVVILTLAGGFRILFRDRPWQPYLLAAYVVFVGHVFLGSVIDTNHWRHFWLLTGMIWGTMGAEARLHARLRLPCATTTATKRRDFAAQKG